MQKLKAEDIIKTAREIVFKIYLQKNVKIKIKPQLLSCGFCFLCGIIKVVSKKLSNEKGDFVMLFTVVVSKEDSWYIAKCVENSVASQGKTIEEAIANLKETLELYYEGEEIQKPQMPPLITTIEVAV